MQVWPAIDLRGGKCVRLRQGDYQQETVFAQNPADVARQFVDQGARHLHVVDLEGAREGLPVNLPGVQEILAAIDIECELGGGIRDEQSVQELFEFGLTRLVIGTSALTDPEWFRAACRQYPGKLVLGIDARDGHAATDGWLNTSNVAAIELAQQFANEPLAAIIYTDIATDGMMRGPEYCCHGRNASGCGCTHRRFGWSDDTRRCSAIGRRRFGWLHYRPRAVRRHLITCRCDPRGQWPRAANSLTHMIHTANVAYDSRRPTRVGVARVVSGVGGLSFEAD